MALQRSLHDAPLHPSAPPVDEANLAQTSGSRRDDVLLDHRRDVAGMERVEVQVRPDRNSDGVRSHLVLALRDKLSTLNHVPATEAVPLGETSWHLESKNGKK